MPRSRPEQQIQAAVVQYLRLALPGALVFSVPNSERRPVPGMYAGLTDVVIDIHPAHRGGPQSEGPYYVEIKAPGGRLTKAQEEFRDVCRRSLRPWACFRSVEDAETALRAWGWRPRATT
jgi:hypothetical protein